MTENTVSSMRARLPIATSTGMMKSPSPQSPILGSIPLSRIRYRSNTPVLDHYMNDKPRLHTLPHPRAELENIADKCIHSCSYRQRFNDTSQGSTTVTIHCNESGSLPSGKLERKACLHEECDRVANMKQELQRAEDEIGRLNAKLTMSGFSWVAIQEACPEVSRLLQLPPQDFVKVLEAQRAHVATEMDGFEDLKKLAHLNKSTINSLEYRHLSELSHTNYSSAGSSIAADRGSICPGDDVMTSIGQDGTNPKYLCMPTQSLPGTLNMPQKDNQDPTHLRDSSPPSPPSLQFHTHNDMALPYSTLLELYQSQCTTLSAIRTDIEVIINAEEIIRAKNAELRAKNSKLGRRVNALAMCRADLEKVIDAEASRSAENVKLREVNGVLKRRVAMLEDRLCDELGLQWGK